MRIYGCLGLLSSICKWKCTFSDKSSFIFSNIPYAMNVLMHQNTAFSRPTLDDWESVQFSFSHISLFLSRNMSHFRGQSGSIWQICHFLVPFYMAAALCLNCTPTLSPNGTFLDGLCLHLPTDMIYLIFVLPFRNSSVGSYWESNYEKS